MPFIDRALSIQSIHEISPRTLQNELKNNMEPIHPVHAPGVELTKEHGIKWEPNWQDKYTGPHRGPHAGPMLFIVDIVRSAKGLADSFLAILPLAFFERFAQLTTKFFCLHACDVSVLLTKD